MQGLKALMLAATLGCTALSGAGLAQETPAGGQVWIQIEARNTQAAAEERLRDWGADLGEVAGFALDSGWYAVMIGPWPDRATAEAELARMRDAGRIPRDSYIARPGTLRRQIWPQGAAATGTTATQPGTAMIPQTPAVAPMPPFDDTRLTMAQRLDLQHALAWHGVYSGAVDGAIGKGSRDAIGAWQAGRGLPATGRLDQGQLDELIGTWTRESARTGLRAVSDGEAGISVELPMGLVEFDTYRPPFAHYRSRAGSGLHIALVSAPGAAADLPAIARRVADVLRLPPDRMPAPSGRELTFSDRQGGQILHVEIRALPGGIIKGFVLSGPESDSRTMTRVTAAMQRSFDGRARRVLDPLFVPIDPVTHAALMRGTQTHRPLATASGFLADARGHVLTAMERVTDCGRITLDGGHDMRLAGYDRGHGIALLAPLQARSTPAHARLASRPPAPGTEVAIAGFGFGSGLARPVVHFGRVGDSATWLRLRPLPAEAGGAVLGPDGLVVGMVLPPATTAPEHGRIASPLGMAGLLQAAGLPVATEPAVDGAMAPEDLTAIGTSVAVQVSCWDR